MSGNIDYAELFGVEEGVEAQELADPASATEDGTEGVEAQEVADPAEIDESGAGIEDDAASDTDGDGAGEVLDMAPAAQSPVERARFAAARRKAEAERDAAVKLAREEAAREAQRAVDETVASLGITNPFTGKLIRTKAEYDAYQNAAQADRREKLIKRAGITDEEYKEFVENLPEVQAARAMKEQAGAAVRSANEAAARQKVEEQLLEIAKFDPSVKTLADLVKTENYQKVYDLVKKGYELSDAYKLANFDRVQKSTADASRQAALNAAAGKGHLSGTSARGSGGVTVPAEVAEMYREMNPGATDAEIQKHYNRYAKK